MYSLIAPPPSNCELSVSSPPATLAFFRMRILPVLLKKQEQACDSSDFQSEVQRISPTEIKPRIEFVIILPPAAPQQRRRENAPPILILGVFSRFSRETLLPLTHIFFSVSLPGENSARIMKRTRVALCVSARLQLPIPTEQPASLSPDTAEDSQAPEQT